MKSFGTARLSDGGGASGRWTATVTRRLSSSSFCALGSTHRLFLTCSTVQGLLDQAMAARIRPIERGMRLVGKAHTVLSADVYQRPENPYVKEIAAVDALTPGDVMVAATNGSERTCLWGELLSTAARAGGNWLPHRRSRAMCSASWRWAFRSLHRISSRRFLLPLGRDRLRVSRSLRRCPRSPGDIIFADIDASWSSHRSSGETDRPAGARESRGRTPAHHAGAGVPAARRLRPLRRALGPVRSSHVACVSESTGGTFTDLVG